MNEIKLISHRQFVKKSSEIRHIIFAFDMYYCIEESRIYKEKKFFFFYNKLDNIYKSNKDQHMEKNKYFTNSMKNNHATSKNLVLLLKVSFSQLIVENSSILL